MQTPDNNQEPNPFSRPEQEVERSPEQEVERSPEQVQEQQAERAQEKREVERVVEETELPAETEAQVQTHAAQMRSMSDTDAEGKVKKLVDLAQSQGVAAAIKTAQKMEDPYILDRLHDELAENDQYQALLK